MYLSLTSTIKTITLWKEHCLKRHPICFLATFTSLPYSLVWSTVWTMTRSLPRRFSRRFAQAKSLFDCKILQSWMLNRKIEFLREYITICARVAVDKKSNESRLSLQFRQLSVLVTYCPSFALMQLMQHLTFYSERLYLHRIWDNFHPRHSKAAGFVRTICIKTCRVFDRGKAWHATKNNGH